MNFSVCAGQAETLLKNLITTHPIYATEGKIELVS